MISPKEFRKHAAECQRMARFVHDKANKARWMGLADRWILAAELAESKNFNRGAPELPTPSLH